MPVFEEMMAAARGDGVLDGAPAGAPVLVARRCVRRLHQASSCTKCVEACPVHAVSVKSRSVEIDAASCTGCGACSAVCPAEALYMRTPGASQERAFLERLKDADTLSIACAQAAGEARHMADLTTACLGTMDMSPVASLAVRTGGACTLHVIHGDCRRCSRRCVSFDPLERMRRWQVALSRTAPEVTLELHAAPKSVDTGRRQFWGRLLRKAELDTGRNVPFDEASLARLETVPLRTVPPARGRWLEALKTASEKGAEALSCMMEAPGRPGFWAPRIDNGACTACGLCPTVCPTAALEEEKLNGVTLMKVTTSKCIGCGLCANICFRNAVQMLPVRHPEESLDEKSVVIFAGRADSADSTEAVWEDKLKTMISAPVYRT